MAITRDKWLNRTFGQSLGIDEVVGGKNEKVRPGSTYCGFERARTRCVIKINRNDLEEGMNLRCTCL